MLVKLVQRKTCNLSNCGADGKLIKLALLKFWILKRSFKDIISCLRRGKEFLEYCSKVYLKYTCPCSFRLCRAKISVFLVYKILVYVK